MENGGGEDNLEETGVLLKKIFGKLNTIDRQNTTN